MSHMQYLPGDPRLVDQLVYELKSKGIFDQFRKECIADVDTRPAYQNLRQRVESSVAAFLARQVWCADLNRNQLREKLRKHLLDANYLEQGVERIVDQVVNPKVSSVFIPQVEDVVYNFLGIPRKKTIAVAESSNGKPEDLLPTDLEAVSPGSVKSNNDKNEEKEEKIEVEEEKKEDEVLDIELPEKEPEESRMSVISELTNNSEGTMDKSNIPMPAEEILLENIPVPENSPPTVTDKNVDVEKIELPKDSEQSTYIYHIPCTVNMDIPLPDEIPKIASKDTYFKPLHLNSENDDSSSDSSIRRNMSPLTPIRNYNNENSCDAQQAFDNDSDSKADDKKEPNTFRFTIESKSSESIEEVKEKKEPEALAYQFSSQVNITNYTTPMYDDSSNSNLRIDYESDANSKVADIKLPEDNYEDSKKDKKDDKRGSSHKSSHKSRDSHRHSSSKDKRSESKHSSSRDSSRHERKSSKDDYKSKSSHKEKSSDKDKKDSRDSSKQRSSSYKSSSHKDSKHRSSSSSKHSSSRHDDKKSTSSRDKEKSSSDRSKNKPRDSKSSSHRSDKDRKKKDDKENKDKKEKKKTDDHYSLSGRGNPNRRSTDRDSNDGSSSSKGYHNPAYKPSESTKETKSSSKSDNTSYSGDSTSPSDKDVVTKEGKSHQNVSQYKKVVRVETRLEAPIATPPRLPFVPDVTLKKPRFAANLEEAKKMIKMRKFLDEEQKRMNQEAALLLEFQANVRPSLSQVYSNIPGPELEFVCGSTEVVDEQAKIEIEAAVPKVENVEINEIKQYRNDEDTENKDITIEEEPKDDIAESLIAMHMESVPDTEIAEEENTETDLSIIATLTDDDDEKVGADKSEMAKYSVEIDVSEVGCENEILEDIINDGESKKVSEDKLELHFFAEHEKYNAELELDKFKQFFKNYTEMAPSKLYLLNCDTYEENLVKEVAANIGNFIIVNYHKNGHLKMPDSSNKLIKDVNVATEISLPTKSDFDGGLFSPAKSECSFELSSDYDAKLEEMVNKTSRQEIMEIILGGGMESPSKMPRIDYCTESSIDQDEISLKRKMNDVETANNNRIVLTPNKIRKLSGSDQISSTTEETIETPTTVVHTTVRSKYLGKAKRVGLPKPKKTPLPNSPSSDKSVENYEQNSPRPRIPNGQVKPRAKIVQRYDTSDLYKPKLHYLSRRNNIS